jgi:hypothetical protein
MTMMMILRRMVPIQPQTMTLKLQANAVAVAVAHSLRSSRCAGRGVGIDPMSMQLKFLTANPTMTTIISNPMIQSTTTCRRSYCRRVVSTYEECGGYLDLKQLQLQLKWRQQQQQQHRQLWRHQMHHRQRRWFTLSYKIIFRATTTLKDCLTSTSCNTVTTTPPLVQYIFQNHHQQRHQQYQQHQHQQQQRAFSSSQSASMDRNGTDVRIIEAEGGRHDVDFDSTSLSIQDHLEKLHSIPLENIRNFCIIAHVVSECVYEEGGRIIVGLP